MSEHPTPEQIAEERPEYARGWSHMFLADLEAYGYVIVHPDDVPRLDPNPGYGNAYDDRWNACRRHIFGTD